MWDMNHETVFSSLLRSLFCPFDPRSVWARRHGIAYVDGRHARYERRYAGNEFLGHGTFVIRRKWPRYERAAPRHEPGH